jgi:hypothetical protein
VFQEPADPPKATNLQPYTALQLPTSSNLVEPNQYADAFLFHCGLNVHPLKFRYASGGSGRPLAGTHPVSSFCALAAFVRGVVSAAA